MIGVWHSVLAAKGDVFVRTAIRDVRLPVGTNGQALIADSTQTAGVKWGNGGGPTVFITGNPNVAVGAELYLVSSVVGSPTLAYEWRRGSTVVGTNSPVLTIATATLADAGDYRCAVSNGEGTIFSDPFPVAVLTPPAITSETPPSGTPTLNAYVDFALTATGSALAYQWQWRLPSLQWAGVVNATTPAGATTPTRTLRASVVHGGIYRCRVFNAVGEVFSSEMVIEMQPPVIVRQPYPIGSSIWLSSNYPGAAFGTASVVATGIGTLAYQWLYDINKAYKQIAVAGYL